MTASEPGSASPVPSGRGVPVPAYGAWLRRGISRNGGPLAEDREVVWLRGGVAASAPVPGADGATGSWSGPDHHVVRVGRHVVHVDSRAGRYWQL
ncbi:hypothetical protein [Streptomyces sp. NPDC048340]|uniref:hypothetical protein n=1 Tax=Streptomyces sp. NPDC048340 TaxID=3365537 RepID=UPI00371A6553